MHAAVQVLIVGELGQADAGKKGADLQGEVQRVRAHDQGKAPREAPDEQHLRPPRRPGEGLRQHITRRQQRRRQQQNHAAKGAAESLEHGSRIQGHAAARAAAEAGEESEDEDGHEVLHQEDAHGDAPVEAVQLAFFIKQLHHHHRAAEGEADGEENGLHEREAEQPAQDEAACGGEDHLADAGDDGDFSHIPDFVEAQLQTDEEKQQGDADFRDEREFGGHLHQPRRRPEPQSREQVGDDGGHADAPRQEREQRRSHHDPAQFVNEGFFVHFPLRGRREEGCSQPAKP